METTFMTIHNLTENANILFASDSIVDVLGYQPGDVLGRSCFDYFHPDEVPFARNTHSRGVMMDKAAMLHYARIKDMNGLWVGCECVFTVVHDVLVACTSIYKRDLRSENRAIEAPAVRRLFASSPRDPRYHMLEHLSPKFESPPQPDRNEPRAALILNRFTRTLAVMYATNAVSSILGVSAEQITGKSFYECIQENCLPEAIRCLESAKANDSIAYLRFWYRDPRLVEDLDQNEREASHSSDEEDGGVALQEHMDIDSMEHSPESDRQGSSEYQAADSTASPSSRQISHGTSSGDVTDAEHSSSNAFSDQNGSRSNSHQSAPNNQSVPTDLGENQIMRSSIPDQPIEIEAVVSCTSDGLVVILRRARPILPTPQQYATGFFAAPWGVEPIRPQQGVQGFNHQPMHPYQAAQVPVGGPPQESFMTSIREVAVFAWSLTGINGNIASYGHGKAKGEASPPEGFPVWDPNMQPQLQAAPVNQAYQKWAELHGRANIRTNENSAHYIHARQEHLLRQQFGLEGHPIGPDTPGSAARRYLGRFMEQDIMSPSQYYPQYYQYAQPPQHQSQREYQGWQDNNSGHSNPWGGQGNPNSGPQQGQHQPGAYQPNAGDSGGPRYMW